AVERQVATKREKSQPGVGVDVAFTDLDESSTKGQYFDPRALCCSRHRVEYDVDAVAVGVAPDCLGELGAARVVDMLNTHVAQHLPTLRATGGSEDLGARSARDGDRCLPYATHRGVDQDLLAGFDLGEVVQAIPGGG